MDVRDRLRSLADALPENGSVTFTRVDLIQMSEAAENHPENDLHGDYTVAQIAEIFDRSPQTVRDWIGSDQLRAYRFNDREYRITASALREFQEGQRDGTSHADRGEVADLGAWRDIVAR